MSRTVQHTRWKRRIGWPILATLAISMAFSACGVTEPDETPWQDVAAFSWTPTPGNLAKYTYITEDLFTESVDTNQVSIDLSDDYYNGQQMFLLNDSKSSIRVSFLPMHDTLIIKRERFGGELALVSPLEKGRTWVSGYIGSEPAWDATVLERFAYRKVEGNTYKNVVAVKYKRRNSNEEYIRFYAEGVGPILTIKNIYPQSSFQGDPVAQQEQRIVLIATENVSSPVKASN